MHTLLLIFGIQLKVQWWFYAIQLFPIMQNALRYEVNFLFPAMQDFISCINNLYNYNVG